MSSVRTLPQIAARIAEILPELGGRSVAVSEAEINSNNVPKLPIAMVGLVGVSANDAGYNNGLASEMKMMEDFVIEVLLEPERRKTKDGGETPFWTFYDYRDYMNRIISGLKSWAPSAFEFVSLDLSADSFAVALTLRFRQHYIWCPLPDDEEPEIIDSSTINWCIGTSSVC